jgi:D-aspartate ligase
VTTPGALVLTGDHRGLGIARSLGRRGIPVWVLMEQGESLARASRYVQRALPFPDGDEEKQRDYLLELADRHRLDNWVLFPTRDDTAALLGRHGDQLAERFRLTSPRWDVMRWAYDKRLTDGLAQNARVDYPWTSYPRDGSDVAAIDCSFPVILKPAVKAELNRFTHDKAWQADDRRTLLARYDEACALVDPELIMVQELIPGGGEAQFSFAALCADGSPLASVVARRTRQYPVDFGHSSSFVETVEEPSIEQLARRLLAVLAYTGLVEIEFKHDARTGVHKLLDINPRVWTWHTLGGRAGVDFPYLAWRLAQREVVPSVRGRAGVRWVRLATDIPAAVGEIRRRRLSLRGYARSFFGPLEPALFAWDDPLPALRNAPLHAYAIVKRSIRMRLMDGRRSRRA